MKERKIIELSERNQNRMYEWNVLWRKGTINFEFAILISIFFIALHAFFHRDLRLSVRTAGGTWTRGTVDCSMRPIDQCLIQPALTVRKGSYPLSPSSLLPSSFNSLFYPLSPRATVKSLRRSVFGAISSYNWRPFDPLMYSGESLGRCFCP